MSEDIQKKYFELSQKFASRGLEIEDLKKLLKEACELLFMGREYNDFDLIRLEDLQNKPEVKKIMEEV